MDKAMSTLDFRLMSFMFKIRDFFLPRRKILEEVGIEPGWSLLDYGCGPGSNSIVAAQMVGEMGKVYALDIHPLAVQQVQNKAAKQRLTNIETILSAGATGLPDDSQDVVLFYDILHALSQADNVLEELHRVLKPGGILSVSDHHLAGDKIMSRITAKGLFQLSKKGKRVYNFLKIH